MTAPATTRRAVLVDDGRPRCLRGRDCPDATPVRDEQSRIVGWAAGLLTFGDEYGLCPGCQRAVLGAVRALPGDVVELFAMLRSSPAVRYRDPGMPTQPRVKLHAPLPFAVEPLTLAELIVHETGEWAAAVADAARIPWDRRWYRRMRPTARVDQACILLARNLGWLYGLGSTRYPARSLTVRRGDGHEGATRDGREVWTVRTGMDGALVLLDLHARAVGMAGRNPADAVPVPCPACRRRTLVREHRARRVYCRAETCDHHMSDDAYQRMATGGHDRFRALSAGLAAERAAEAEGEGST